MERLVYTLRVPYHPRKSNPKSKVLEWGSICRVLKWAKQKPWKKRLDKSDPNGILKCMKRHDVKPGQVLHRRHNGERVVVEKVCHLPGESVFTVTPCLKVKGGEVFTLSSGFRELPVLLPPTKKVAR